MGKRKTLLTCLLVAVGLVVVTLILVAGLVLYIVSMPRQRYSDEDAAATLAAGTELMQSWLDEHESGARITSSTNHLKEYPSGPSYLTDLVDGTYEAEGATHLFTIDVTNGTVYLEDVDGLLMEALPPYLAEVLDLPEGTEFSDVNVSLLLPCTIYGSHTRSRGNTLPFYGMLPAGVDDAAAWLRNPGARCDVAFNASAYLKDVDVSDYTFLRMLKLRDEAGISYEGLRLWTESETLDLLYNHYFYEHFTWGNTGPFRVWYRDSYLEQELERDFITRKIGSSNIDLARDLKVSGTDDQIILHLRSEANIFPYNLYVDAGSPLLERDWLWTGTDGYERELTWADKGEDGWTLCDEDGLRWTFYGSSLLSAR